MPSPADSYAEFRDLLSELGAEPVGIGALAALRYRAEPRRSTVEDVIVHELIAWRDKDRDDIASILSTSPALDETYIERWAQEWDVADRWASARAVP